jgi:hypothetical protein
MKRMMPFCALTTAALLVSIGNAGAAGPVLPSGRNQLAPLQSFF